MIRRAVASLLLLSACDQVFGADPPPAPTMTGTLVVREVRNDEAGAPVLTVSPPDLARASVTASFSDGTQTPIELAEDGTFAVELPQPGERYRLLLQFDNQLIELQHTALALTFDFYQLGRPNYDRMPPTRTTNVATGELPGRVLFASTGVWTATEVTLDAVTHLHQLDWRDATSLFGRRGLLSADQHDDLYLLNHGRENLLAPWTITMGRRVRTSLEDGGSVSLGGVTALTNDLCAALRSPLRTDAKRFETANPSFTGGSTPSWRVQAVPSLDLGTLGGHDVLYYDLYGIDVDREDMFVNPFVGTSLIASTRVDLGRAIELPGAIPNRLTARLEHYVPIAAAATCGEPVEIGGEIGLPTTGAIDGVPLEEGREVRIDRSRDAVLTWELADPGPVDRWAIQLVEIYEDPLIGLTLPRLVRTYVTVDTRVDIDPALLVPGTAYVIMIRGDTGFAGAADGDLATFAFPRSSAMTYSPLFFVR